MSGKIYGLGVGPGDPELLTIKAYRILQEVDLLCVPKSKAEKQSLALSVVNKAVNRDFEVLELLFPMTHDPEILKNHWDEATEQMVKQVRSGKNIAFITIGDPMFYSTYAYVLHRVKEKYPGISIETVPGVTAFSACASLLNAPVTESDEKLVVIPAVYGIEAVKKAIQDYENVILMKVNRLYDQVVNLLKEQQMLDKAVYISRCGYREEFYTTELEKLIGQDKDYMSMMIIRKAGWKNLCPRSTLLGQDQETLNLLQLRA